MPLTKKSLTSSLTSTTARLLAARPWLAPALGALVLLAGATTWLWLTPVEDQGPLVQNLKVLPGLASVRVTFTTPRPMHAGLDVVPTTPRTQLPEAGAAVTEHQLTVTGLAATTEHKLSVMVEGVRRLTVPFRTQALLYENLRRDAHLDALTLAWTTSMPVRSTVLYAAPGRPEQKVDVDEPLGTVHQARIGGLSRDLDYQVTLVSTTATGEVSRGTPFPVKLFASAWSEALAAIRSASIPERIRAVFGEVGKKASPERLPALLAERVDPIRAPLAQVRKVSREFFGSPDVVGSAKLEVYATLKLIEHLERLALVRNVPLVELLSPFDWGPYAQVDVSFSDPRLPLPLPRANTLVAGYATPDYFRRPELLPGIVVDQQLVASDGPHWLKEWRAERENDAIAVFDRGARDGAREMTFTYALSDPARVGAAELWLAHSDCSPLQFFELEVNGASPLILRPPLQMKKDFWYRAATRLDPALLIPGQNVVKLRLKAIPEMFEGRRAQVWYVELRTRLKGA